MKNILTQVLVTLGVIFLILIVISIYFFVTDPYNLKPLIFGTDAPASFQVAPKNTGTPDDGKVNDATASETSSSGGFQLSEAQKQALTSLGVDPAAVPSTISSEQEACFVTTLGASRVGEIKAGAVPNALEFAKAKGCI